MTHCPSRPTRRIPQWKCQHTWVMKIGVSFSKLVLLSGPAEDGGEGQCRPDQEHPEEPDGDADT